MGLATDTNIIRIGSGQTQAFIAGVITGNGGGLTNVNLTGLPGKFRIGPTSANGYQALQSNTTGSYNTANGYQALQSTRPAATTRPMVASALLNNTSWQLQHGQW